MNICFYVFEDFETLDLFGPVEILCRVPELTAEYYSINGGIVKSAQGTEIATKQIKDYRGNGIFLIPGGRGTRPLVNREIELAAIKDACNNSTWVLSVCTGSAVLAKCGLLEGKQATSNKKAFDWVCSCNSKVNWQKEPRFCKDGRFYTSAGVSAGIDMAIEFVKDNYGKGLAEKIIEDIEWL